MLCLEHIKCLLIITREVLMISFNTSLVVCESFLVIARYEAYHIFNDRLSMARAASRITSERLGCGWQVRATSSDEARNSMASAASASERPLAALL